MKKIVMFIPSMYSTGGAERVTHALAEDLTEIGHEVHVVTLSENNFEDYSYISHALKKEKGALSKILSFFTVPFLLSRYCKQHNIDVVISHMERANFLSLLSKNIVTKVCVVHGVVGITLKRNYLLLRLLYKKADKIVTVSQGINERLTSMFALENVETIYNYLDIDSFLEQASQPLHHDDEAFFGSLKGVKKYISVGRLESVKNHSLLIKAMKNIEGVLLIVGSGSLEGQLREKIKQCGLEDRVFLLGERKNVAPLLMRSDCFVLSSNKEGFGMVLVEALAAQIPIVSTNCEYGPKEILTSEEETFAILVPTHDVQKLVGAMKLSDEINTSRYIPRAKTFSKELTVAKWSSVIC